MALHPDTVISVVTLIDNDAELLRPFLVSFAEVMKGRHAYHELLLVDNGSVDGSDVRVAELQKEFANIHYIRLSRRHDSELAYSAGLENSIGDYVVVMDLRHDPASAIPLLLDAASEGCEVVIGERSDASGAGWLYRAAESAFYRLANLCLPYPLDPKASYFRCLSRQVVNSVTRIRNKTRHLKYLSSLVGFKQRFVAYHRKPLVAGLSARPGFGEALASGISIIVSNSALPLRFASLLALSASFLSLLYFAYVLVVGFFKSKVAEGWMTTNGVSTLMFLLLFLILTILAEYVARLLEEVQDRPLYFIESESYSPVTFFKKDLTERLNVD